MSGRRRLYLGTQTGLQVLSERGAGWEHDEAALPGRLVTSIITAGRPARLLAGVAYHGVFRSADAGAHWEQVLEADVRSLTADPADPNTVYAGTEPVHLFRSTDGGRTWAELDSLLSVPEAVQERWWFPIYPHEPHVLSIAVNPHNARQIYLGLEHGGILRSDDGGQSWEDVSHGIEYLDIHMVGCDPARDGLVYSATARGFYRSQDDGRTWILSDAGFTRDYMHDFTVHSGPRSTLFMTTANGTPPNWLRPSAAEAAIFRSDDEGLTWRRLGGGLPADMKRMVWNIAPDPLEADRLYACAGDYPDYTPPGQARGELWTSPDRGDTWERLCDLDSPAFKVCACPA